MKTEGQVTRTHGDTLTAGDLDIPKSHIGNSLESLQMFLEEEMMSKEETKSTNFKLISPTLMKNPPDNNVC